MIQTELQRVQSATNEQKMDFANRLNSFEKYAIPDKADPENVSVACFCCNKKVTNDVLALAHMGNNVFKTVMIHLECEDHPLIWRESTDGYSYVIVIGDSGPQGLTPETTKFIGTSD
jgi:hypothetical protein